jgi:hypothetical protein
MQFIQDFFVRFVVCFCWGVQFYPAFIINQPIKNLSAFGGQTTDDNEKTQRRGLSVCV